MWFAIIDKGVTIGYEKLHTKKLKKGIELKKYDSSDI